MNTETGCGKCTSVLWSRYRSGQMPVIPDIKCKSPAEGDLLIGRDPAALARELAAAGAPVLSVVTEESRFGGSPRLFRRITAAVSVPVLRKDFIDNREQLLESADIGAAGVLLIAARLKAAQLYRLIEEAFLLGLEPLVEVRSEKELALLDNLELSFVGINNRNILEWELDDGDVGNTEKLAAMVRPGALLVSESSIASVRDVLRARRAGAHAVLVGTAILKAGDPAEMYRRLSGPGEVRS